MIGFDFSDHNVNQFIKKMIGWTCRHFDLLDEQDCAEVVLQACTELIASGRWQDPVPPNGVPFVSYFYGRVKNRALDIKEEKLKKMEHEVSLQVLKPEEEDDDDTVAPKELPKSCTSAGDQCEEIQIFKKLNEYMEHFNSIQDFIDKHFIGIDIGLVHDVMLDNYMNQNFDLDAIGEALGIQRKDATKLRSNFLELLRSYGHWVDYDPKLGKYIIEVSQHGFNKVGYEVIFWRTLGFSRDEIVSLLTRNGFGVDMNIVAHGFQDHTTIWANRIPQVPKNGYAMHYAFATRNHLFG
ncbi:MAG: hypothetical protein KGZ83_18755 [Sulfuricella sp.]|nr:hypothetical protein [Sulfuricella sp.]